MGEPRSGRQAHDRAALVADVDAALVRTGADPSAGVQPPALIVWGPHDGYMPEKSALTHLTTVYPSSVR
ncbi:hypothetical protein [Mycolicibacterium sp. P9-64]|uniref:hypothetical protein n=1 Tax=Mycolicibacterium sp. P9-64 TaxID=2024612 RepID=UPI001F5BE408|nr:hypothetical protein [Mycolicibacterium sp. P9-64]